MNGLYCHGGFVEFLLLEFDPFLIIFMIMIIDLLNGIFGKFSKS